MSEPLSVEEVQALGEHIAEQAVHLDAAMHRLLADLRTFDAAGGWYRQGFGTCAHWLSWRVGWVGQAYCWACGLRPRTARPAPHRPGCRE